MANKKVGTKTGKQTQAGRDVYVTPEGENVSEKSTTFKYKGKWINIPSIHDGHRYDDDTLKIMLEAEIISPTSIHENRQEAEAAAKKRSDELKFNKGGTPMKDQMELFEDGGLKDEGGTVDEVSGNEVPIGGTKKGVRDDVPAMVSEGEFVFPEDVTRYIGLDKLMQLRQEAKMGLKRMEAMGQMGNGDEATMPDDMPFSMADLVIVAGDTGEELEMQEGGFITRPTTVTRTQPQSTYTSPPQQFTTAQPTSVRRLTPEIQRPQRSSIDFKKLMGEASISYVEYRNAAGANMMIPHINGVPVFPIPEGYTRYEGSNAGDTSTGEEAITEEVIQKSTAFNEAKESNSDPIIKNAFVEAGSWDNSPIDMYLKEALKFVNGTSATVNGLVTAVSGGVLSPFVYGFSALEKRRILATIDERIKNNPKQAADLLKIKKALEEGKPLQSAISFVANAVKGIGQKIFGLEKEQAEAAATNTIQTEIEQVAPSYATMDMGEAGRTSRPMQEQVVSTQPAETAPVSTFDSAVVSQLAQEQQAEYEKAAFGQPVQEQTEAAFGDAGSYLASRQAAGEYARGDSFAGGDFQTASMGDVPVPAAPVTTEADEVAKVSAQIQYLLTIEDPNFKEEVFGSRGDDVTLAQAQDYMDRSLQRQGYGELERKDLINTATSRILPRLDPSKGLTFRRLGEAPSFSPAMLEYSTPERIAKTYPELRPDRTFRDPFQTEAAIPVYLPTGEVPPSDVSPASSITTQAPTDLIALPTPSGVTVPTTEIQPPASIQSGAFKSSVATRPISPPLESIFMPTVADASTTAQKPVVPYTPPVGDTGRELAISGRNFPTLPVTQIQAEPIKPVPSPLDVAFNKLSPEAQARVSTRDIDATVANARNVIEDRGFTPTNITSTAPTVTYPEISKDASISDSIMRREDRGFTPTNIAPLAPTATYIDPRETIEDRGFTPTNIAPLAATATYVDPTEATLGRGFTPTNIAPLAAKTSVIPKSKKAEPSFDEAFSAARKAEKAAGKKSGTSTFEYKGKSYTTETAKEKDTRSKTTSTTSRADGDRGYMVEGAGYTTINGKMPTSEQQKEQRIAAWAAVAAGKDPQAAVFALVNKQKDDKPTTTTSSTDKTKNVASSGRTEAEIQKEINAELDKGGWNSKLNDLVKERDSARSNEGTSGSGDSGGSSTSSSIGGGYSCYVATALSNKGYWSNTRKLKLIKWCINAKPEGRLDTKLWRNGYVTFGKNVIAPRVSNKIIQWLSNGFYYATVYKKKNIQAIVGKLFFYIPSYTIGIWKALRGKLVDIERT